MAKIEKYTDLKIFQLARQLCKDVYEITETLPWRNDSRFVQQIHAAAGSIMDNIAEGFERDGNKEFINFLYYAKGSCGEVGSQLMRANDVGFLSNEKYLELNSACDNISKGIAGLIASLRRSEIQGRKYQK